MGKWICRVRLVFHSFLLSQFGCNRALALLTLHQQHRLGSVFSQRFGQCSRPGAPSYAGKLMRLTSTMVNLGVIGAPLTVEVLTSRESTRAAWQTVFYISAAIYTPPDSGRLRCLWFRQRSELDD